MAQNNFNHYTLRVTIFTVSAMNASLRHNVKS